MGLIYLIFNQLPFLWDTSENKYILIHNQAKAIATGTVIEFVD